MRTRILKALMILTVMLLSSVPAKADGLLERFKDFASNEFNSLQGLYIMAGIVVASLVIYILLNHFGKEEERRAPAHYTHTRRHRHHHHRVIKKTS